MLFFRELFTGKSALNFASEPLRMDEVGNINELTFYIVGTAGIAAGAVQAEEAHDKDYTGTWAPNGAPVNAVVSGLATVKITGVSAASRLRISTAIVGGTISGYAVGR